MADIAQKHHINNYSSIIVYDTNRPFLVQHLVYIIQRRWKNSQTVMFDANLGSQSQEW